MGIKIKIDGIVDMVGEVKEFSSGFRKVELVIDTSNNTQFPCPIAVTFKKDDVDKVNNIVEGDIAHVEGFLCGRRWDGPQGTKHYLEIDAKSLIVEKSASTAAPVTASSWEDVRNAYAKSFGCSVEDTKKGGAKFKEFVDWCKLSADGKPLKEFTDADRAKCVNAIANAPAEDLEEDPDDMPF